MKKISTKKLSVSKLTVAVLTPDQLASVGGGQMAYTKVSVCADQCCKSDYCSGSSGC